MKIVASERYNPTDPSVTAQVLKLLAANPDGVYVFASGTPGALPQIELAQRGYKGPVYQTQGVANNDFLRVGGKELEGSFMTVAPVLVADQLPDANPVKAPGVDYVTRYEARYGPGSRSLFGATAWDAMLMVQQAAKEAMAKKTKPGTPEFRAGLRDALETMGRTVFAHGVMNWTKDDHWGFTNETGVMLKVVDGKFKVE